jgi:mannose-6-phosphate isomerase-like protein (cupin superfamily)
MSSIERIEVRTAALDGWFVDRIAETALGTAAGPAGALVEREAPRRGLMPPLHARSQDETYHVLAGELIFFVGDEVVRARPGDVVVAPRGVPRTYRVESEGARWLVLTRRPPWHGSRTSAAPSPSRWTTWGPAGRARTRRRLSPASPV